MKKPRTPERRGAEPAVARAPTYDDLLAIVRLVESGSRFSEFRLKLGDIEVEITRANGVEPAATPVAAAEPAPAFAPPGVGPRSAGEVPPGAHVIKSPMVGTFYRSPEPGAPPFVEVGTRVTPETIVCIIEVMKLMNSVPAGIEGSVTHVFAENAHPVEFGQPLVAIAPVR